MVAILQHGQPYSISMQSPSQLHFLRRLVGWDVPRRHIRHIRSTVPRYHFRRIFLGNYRPLKPRLKLEHERRNYVQLAKRINARRREMRDGARFRQALEGIVKQGDSFPLGVDPGPGGPYMNRMYDIAKEALDPKREKGGERCH